MSSIANPDGFIADPVLIGVYSATLDEGELDFEDDEIGSEAISRKELFLKSIEDKVDLGNSVHKERFMEIKNRIIEKVKATKVSRGRSRSQSSKRGRSNDSQVNEDAQSPVRARTSGIPVKF